MTEKTVRDKSVSERLYGSWQAAVDVAFEGKTRRQRFLIPAVAAIYLLIAVLISGKTPTVAEGALGVPLADALLISSGPFTPFVYAGAVIGSVCYGHGSPTRYVLLTLTLALRLISGRKKVSGKPFGDGIAAKFTVSAVIALAESMLHTSAVGLNADSARAALATLITLPVFTLIGAVYFAKPSDGKTQKSLYEICFLLFFGVITWSAAGIRFAFCSISTLTAVFITLCVAKYGGFARGAVTGLTLGHLADGELFLPLALLGAAASVLFSFGVFSACGISATAAGVLAAMLNGPEALLSVIPDLVISIAVSSPILRYKLLYKDFPYPSIAPVIPETPSDRSKALLDRLSSWKRLSAASDSIATLDERVASITSASAPGVAAEEGAERIRDQLCHDCPMSAICLENENDRTRNALNGLLLGQNDGSEYLSEHCVRLDDMLKLAKKESRSVINAKAPIRSPLLSYSSASALMTSLAEKAENELQFDRDAEAAITRALYNAGVPFSGISVLGRTRKPIYLYGADRKKLSKALPSLLPEIGKVLLCDYVGPSYGADGDAPAVFVPKRRLSAEIAFRSLSKDGQSVCGDTAISFSDDEGNLFALIADGMGSGHSACRSSGITAEMIRTLSVCGIGGRLAASLADEALKSLCDECFSTVDLLRIDLISGNASLTKSYAAPSFLLRNGSVYRCAPASLPIGACDCSEASEESFRLGAGDTVLMVSDGICDGNEQALTDLLGLSSALKAEEIANRIISRLAPSGRTDDMSAIVIRLSEAV